MKCPFCESELGNCYLESSGFLYLTTKLHPFAGPQIAPKKDKIARLNGRKEGTGIPVQYCPACRKVSFRYCGAGPGGSGRQKRAPLAENRPGAFLRAYGFCFLHRPLWPRGERRRSRGPGGHNRR